MVETVLIWENKKNPDKYVYCCESHSCLAISYQADENPRRCRKIEGVSFKRVLNSGTSKDWTMMQYCVKWKLLLCKASTYRVIKSIGIISRLHRPADPLLLYAHCQCHFGQGSLFPFTPDHFEMKYWIGISLDSCRSFKIIWIYVCVFFVCMHVCF